MQYQVNESRLIQFKTDGVVDSNAVALNPKLLHALESNLGIEQLFCMQEKVVSHLLSASEKGQVGDVVLCAPTGSGKTLAYALPIVQDLLNRKIPKLRALVIVPTRDLAAQVKQVFESLTKGLGISVAIISGATSITLESSMLSKAEIVIATPGRLVDHLGNNDGFRLDAVKFLVLDESDRLLEESFQGWIDALIPIVGTRRNRSCATSDGHTNTHTRPTSGILALAINPEVSARSFVHSKDSSEENVRKILVSATQTTNPKRLVKLGLRSPTIFEPEASANISASDKVGSELSSSKQFSVPSSMAESGWVLPFLQDKPIGLLKLLGWVQVEDSSDEAKNTKFEDHCLQGGTKLIFTKSVESAHRLCRLLELCAYLLEQDVKVFEMSGDLSTQRRQYVLDTVKNTVKSTAHTNGRHRLPSLIVVCSDVLARGMDISNVDAVVNYDAPVHIQTYVHRAGRTARAGRAGTVTTLLVQNQAHHFRKMLRYADRGSRKVPVKTLSVIAEDKTIASAKLSYALMALKRVLTREKLALLPKNDSLPKYALFELCKQARESAMSDINEDGSDDARMRDHTESERTKKRHKGDDGYANGDTIPMQEAEDSGDDEGDEIGDDNVTDLLFAQLARNFLQPCS